MTRSRLIAVLLRPRFLLVLYTALILFATAQQYLKHTIDNYKIFTLPFFHLLEGRDLYADYPELYSVPYKYSPAFALAMGPLALLPDWLGLLIWNVVNTAVLFTAAWRLFPDQRRSVLLLWLIVVDVMTSLQNSQSNALLLGLMLWTFVHLEHRRWVWVGLCVALAFFIKIYGIGIGLIFLFYRGWWRGALWAGLFGALLALSPLLLVSWPELQIIYQGWFGIVRVSTTNVQLSLMGVLEAWFGLTIAKAWVQGAGLLLLLLPLVHWRSWAEVDYRRLYVAVILIFVVVFNQMGESPTYLIASGGFAFWFLLYRHSLPRLAWVLLALVVVFTSLSPTDIFPPSVRHQIFQPYKVKAVPMILAWAVIMSQLVFYPRWRTRLRQSATAVEQDADSAIAGSHALV